MLRCTCKIPGPSGGYLAKLKTTNVKSANARGSIVNEYLLHATHCGEGCREFNAHNCLYPKHSPN